jgi:cytochrome P450
MDRPPLADGHYPVVGHVPTLLRNPLGAITRWGRTAEGLCRLDIAGREVCLVTAPELVGQVLATDSRAYQKADIVREMLGTLQGGSLVLLDGAEWQDRRETLQPAFSRDRVANAGPMTVRRTTERVETWPDGDPVRLVEESRTLVLDILAEALFGLDFDGEDTPFHRASEDILARMELRSVSTYLPESVPTPTNLRFRRAVSTLHDELDTVVARASAQTDTRDDSSLLSILLAAGVEPATVRDELIALLFAGYDSTATALSCTLALLGGHPGIQSALRTELERVLGGQEPTPEALGDLPVLGAVLRESLRLYPPQYLLFREPTTEVDLGGYRIEEGTMVVPAPWIVHRDAQFWTDPTAFRPGRWLEDGSDRLPGEHPEGDVPEFAYVPYGAGPRHCLGAGIADQTLRLAVAVVCQHRELNLAGSLSVGAGPTLSVDQPLRVRTFRDALG